MLRDPKSKLVAAGSEGFVPELWLSPYVKEQLSAMDQCDTITIDPHKSGFCPYPAGALCYRDKLMNTFLQITTTVVYYHGDMRLGDIGIEGSKPGAAAAGVMLANRVRVHSSFITSEGGKGKGKGKMIFFMGKDHMAFREDGEGIRINTEYKKEEL